MKERKKPELTALQQLALDNLDAYKTKLGIQEDQHLAQKLGMQPAMLSAIRRGSLRIPKEAYIRVIDALDQDLTLNDLNYMMPQRISDLVTQIEERRRAAADPSTTKGKSFKPGLAFAIGDTGREEPAIEPAAQPSKFPNPAITTAADGGVQIDLNLLAWEDIQEAAGQSTWMPPEYTMNDWVSDVCRFLREGYQPFQDAIGVKIPPIPDRVKEELRQVRALAMHQCMAARIPECADFAKIAQSLDWAMTEMGICPEPTSCSGRLVQIQEPAAGQADSEIPAGALQQTGALYDIGRKWIRYAQSTGDTNDIAVAVWAAVAEARMQYQLQSQ